MDLLLGDYAPALPLDHSDLDLLRCVLTDFGPFVHYLFNLDFAGISGIPVLACPGHHGTHLLEHLELPIRITVLLEVLEDLFGLPIVSELPDKHLREAVLQLDQHRRVYVTGILLELERALQVLEGLLILSLVERALRHVRQDGRLLVLEGAKR